MRRLTTTFALAVAVLSTGCSTIIAPQYTPSLDNVQTLKDGGDFAAKVGKFASSNDKGNANPISLRGSKMSSPYQSSYADYVAEAIKQEMAMAKKLSPATDIEISGTVLKNDVDIAGFTLGTTEIQARFVVMRGEKIRYDQVKSARHEFPSSFVGAIALPRAIQEYPTAIQKLLASLYADEAFIKALK